jgi:isopenicillin-N epimerase
MSERPIEDDSAWDDVREQWQLRADTTYLNHGSFGPPPDPVRAARRRWIDQLDEQPMDFFVRKLMPALRSARADLAAFVGSRPENLVFVENATSGMNVIADSFPLRPQDEVLLTDHEYGAVMRVWERACRRVGAAPPRVAHLPMPVESPQQIVDKIFETTNERTRLIVVSHITSATAIILPVGEICRRARELGIEVCVDGPHAPVQVPLDIESLKCDYYTASCHKWLCAPFGSGFLYVAPNKHHQMQPQQLSWGTVPPEVPARWDDEFFWRGTRDPSAFLST